MPDESDDYDLRQVIEIPEVQAPAESHLQSFRMVDRKFAGGGESEIFVTFRESVSKRTGKVRPATTYRYHSTDHTGLRQTFEAMTIAAHPGEVLHAELVKTGVPYEQVV